MTGFINRRDAGRKLAQELLKDEVVCLITPRPFSAIGLWYADFSQTTDKEVRDLLEEADHLWMSRSHRYHKGEQYEHRVTS